MAEVGGGSSRVQGQPVEAVNTPPRLERVRARQERLEQAVAKAQRRKSPRVEELQEALAIARAEAELEERKRKARAQRGAGR